MTVWPRVRQLLAIQLALGVGAQGLLLLTPIGLSFGVPVAALAVLFGAYGWAVRVGRPQDWLGAAAVRALAGRVGAVSGIAIAVGYGVLGLVPGQLDLPLGGLLAVAVALGVGGGGACAGLTLCGLDLGRSAADPA